MADAATRRGRFAALLRDAGEAHHHAFAHVNGQDAGWATWYAEWLAARLESAVGLRIDGRRLAGDLVSAESEHRRHAGATPWPEFYAGWILSRHDRA